MIFKIQTVLKESLKKVPETEWEETIFVEEEFFMKTLEHYLNIAA